MTSESLLDAILHRTVLKKLDGEFLGAVKIAKLHLRSFVCRDALRLDLLMCGNPFFRIRYEICHFSLGVTAIQSKCIAISYYQLYTVPRTSHISRNYRFGM